jgi:hypothetical protein
MWYILSVPCVCSLLGTVAKLWTTAVRFILSFLSARNNSAHVGRFYRVGFLLLSIKCQQLKLTGTLHEDLCTFLTTLLLTLPWLPFLPRLPVFVWLLWLLWYHGYWCYHDFPVTFVAKIASVHCLRLLTWSRQKFFTLLLACWTYLEV